MKALEIHGLSKIFRGKRGAKIEALRNLTLSIEQGEVFGFLGPNGAGKSTTIKIIMGLIRATAGTAKIMGQDIVCGAARGSVGYLPENPAFYDYLTAEEYLRFVGRTFGMPAVILEKRLEESLRLLELWDARKRPMRGYSKGMVQRVGLAQVLIHDPEVYILDEPMSGLDPLGRVLVKNIIQNLKLRGKSVFFSTHIISDVETVCDRVGVIVKGDLRCIKKVDEVTTGGITGYEVRHAGHDDLNPVVELVTKEELAEKLMTIHIAGRTVLVVEPVRKSLEEFFVEIVSQERD